MALILISSLCSVASTHVSAAGHTWYVDDSGNDGTGDGSSGNPWATIQHAVSDIGVTDDDTVIVGDGTYTENITVDKELIIQSQNGAAVTTITTGGGDTIIISADNVTISGFTISSSFSGIYLHGEDANHVTGCTVSNNVLTGNIFGILLDYADDNTISANNCDGNSWGVFLLYSTSNMITGNSCMNGVATEGLVSGIYLDNSSDNTISDNRCNRNGDGIIVDAYCFNNTISNNYCADNNEMGGGWFNGATGYGILLRGRPKITIYTEIPAANITMMKPTPITTETKKAASAFLIMSLVRQIITSSPVISAITITNRGSCLILMKTTIPEIY
jgi:parallel beta-helix repeat protein